MTEAIEIDTELVQRISSLVHNSTKGIEQPLGTGLASLALCIVGTIKLSEKLEGPDEIDGPAVIRELYRMMIAMYHDNSINPEPAQ